MPISIASLTYTINDSCIDGARTFTRYLLISLGDGANNFATTNIVIIVY